MNSKREDKLLTMNEVKERLRFKGQGGLQRLIREDPDFVTFKVTHLPNSPRRMRESALEAWVRKQELKERPAA